MTTHTAMLLVGATVPAGAEDAVDVVLARWSQELRHRLLGAGVEIHGVDARLVPLPPEAIQAALTEAVGVMRGTSTNVCRECGRTVSHAGECTTDGCGVPVVIEIPECKPLERWEL